MRCDREPEDVPEDENSPVEDELIELIARRAPSRAPRGDGTDAIDNVGPPPGGEDATDATDTIDPEAAGAAEDDQAW